MSSGRTNARALLVETVEVWWQHRLQGPSQPGDSSAFLRATLARYLGHEPVLERDALGKPQLPPGADDTIRFSLSHSGAWIAVAVTHCAEVGLDVERMRRLSDVEAMIDRCCTPTEAERVRRYPPRTRTRALLEVWTLKEAYLKGLGTGIRCRLTDVDTRLSTSGLGWQVQSTPEPGPHWHAQRLAAPRGYLAALCCAEPGKLVRHRRA
jgi:phosphopantetheinyl transferase